MLFLSFPLLIAVTDIVIVSTIQLNLIEKYTQYIDFLTVFHKIIAPFGYSHPHSPQTTKNNGELKSEANYFNISTRILYIERALQCCSAPGMLDLWAHDWLLV